MNNQMTVNNRSELLFLYDVSYANPNGDPLDSNKPRIDEETGKNIVTDVRLKRTIRDYLHENKGDEIFIREIADDAGNIQDAKTRAEDFLKDGDKKVEKSNITISQMKEIILRNILDSSIDVRLFGATIPIEKDAKSKSSITLTGPVQFKMGQSLHRVKLQYIKGTGAFASGSNSTQKTFREEYVLPYSLIAFYGVVNENAAKHTELTKTDIDQLLEAIWQGTHNLISRSKFGQEPRVLIKVDYKEQNFYIGELDKLVELEADINEEEIRDISEVRLNFSKFLKALEKNKDKIGKIEIKINDRVKATQDLVNEIRALGISVKDINF